MTPQEPDLKAVLSRLEKVEKQNRRFKIAGALALLIFAVSILILQPASPDKPKAKSTIPDATGGETKIKTIKADVVEAKEFIVRDSKGKVRVRLYTDACNRAGILIYDKKHKPPRASFDVGVYGQPAIRFKDENNNILASLSLGSGREHIVVTDKKHKPVLDKNGEIRAYGGRPDRDNTPRLLLCGYSKNGSMFAKYFTTPRAELSLNSDGQPSLRLWDKNKKIRSALLLSLDGQPFLQFHDKNEKCRAGLSLSSDDQPYLTLSDKNTKVRAALSLSPDGQPHLRFWDKNEKGRAALSLNPNGHPYFEIRDKNEKVRGELSLDSDDQPQLRFWDKNKKHRAIFSLIPDGLPSLVLFDENAKVRFLQGLTNDDQPFLQFNDKSAKVRLLQGLIPDGQPYLNLFDANHNLRSALGWTKVKNTTTGAIIERPASSLTLFGENGKSFWQTP